MIDLGYENIFKFLKIFLKITSHQTYLFKFTDSFSSKIKNTEFSLVYQRTEL